jgi:hypothetical protein
MFDISLMEKFYLYNENKIENEISDDVKSAYFIFIREFCSSVSSVWKIYLKRFCEYRDTASFVQKLTRSDEAFAYWLVSCLYPKCVTDAEFIKKNSWDKWNQQRKKGKAGKHVSLIKFDDYVAIYNKISELRENNTAYDFWQNIFFSQFFNVCKQESVPKPVPEQQKEKKATIAIPNDYY